MNANPSDPALQQALQDALQKLRDAQLASSTSSDTADMKKTLEEIKTNTDPNTDPGTALPADTNNSYDSTIGLPVKNDLGQLIQSFISSSPFAAMIGSLHAAGTDEESIFSVSVYNTELKFDFTQWQTTFAGLGTLLLAVSHAAALYIVFRKGA